MTSHEFIWHEWQAIFGVLYQSWGKGQSSPLIFTIFQHFRRIELIAFAVTVSFSFTSTENSLFQLDTVYQLNG